MKRESMHPFRTELLQHARYRAKLAQLIRWYFSDSDPDRAVRLATHLSDLDPLKVNTGTPCRVGLFQLTADDVGLPEEELWRLANPIVNVAMAHRLLAQRGWSVWPEPPQRLVMPVPPLPKKE